MSQTNSQIKKTRVVVGCGILSALATGLQYLEIPSPVSFIAFDFSDLPALLGAFVYGPFAGVIVELVKNLFHLAVSRSGYIGELSNFILGAAFTFSAGLIYKRKKTLSWSVISGAIGAAIMATISYPSNLFVVYPFYYNFMPKEAVLAIYQEVFKVSSVELAILIYNVPFTLIKGLVCVAICAALYNPINSVVKKFS